MIQQKQPNRSVPSEESLKLLLKSGMVDAVQALLDSNPELKYKIENGQLVDSLTGAALWLKKFITSDPDTLKMKQEAAKIADVNEDVLITGESGTGKELIARAMLGDRTGKFVRINCAAMPDGLIESELFGSVKGAYTGSTETKKGMIKSADNGVMFLDEIGDLPLMTQAKLLNVLQPIDKKRYVRAVGSTDETEITCRFVCATHRDLGKMVSAGLFRQDLYARISTFELNIKPLRSRMEDVEPILIHLGEELGMVEKAKVFVEKFRKDIIDDKIDLSLNVRSLERALKRFNTWGHY